MTQCAEVISTLVISKQLWCRCFEPSLSPSSNISAHWSYGNYSHYPSWASLTNFFTVYQTPQSSLLMMVTARAKQQQRKCCQQLGTPFQLLPADWERIYCKWYFCCWIQCLVWKATFSKWKWQCPVSADGQTMAGQTDTDSHHCHIAEQFNLWLLKFSKYT